MLSVLNSLWLYQVHLQTWAILNSGYFGGGRFYWATMKLLRGEHGDGWLLLVDKVSSLGGSI